MSIGLPAQYLTIVRHGAELHAVRAAVYAALEDLGWRSRQIDNDRLGATVGPSLASWGERVEVSLATPGVLSVRSRGLNPLQIFDWGKNAKNVRAFIDVFEARTARDCLTPEPEHFDDEGLTPTGRALAG